ncbi:MAG: hypothetical protein NVS3B25_07460 [Hymenobacter sp.]
MTLFTTTYAPNQAVHEYQAALTAQRATDRLARPAEIAATARQQVVRYTLKTRVPDWSKLLLIGNPAAWSVGSLITAVAHLKAATTSLPDAPAADVEAQLDRLETHLIARLR